MLARVASKLMQRKSALLSRVGAGGVLRIIILMLGCCDSINGASVATLAINIDRPGRIAAQVVFFPPTRIAAIAIQWQQALQMLKPLTQSSQLAGQEARTRVDPTFAASPGRLRIPHEVPRSPDRVAVP